MSQRQGIAFALMVIGVIFYAIFHLWDKGWRTWPGVLEILFMPQYLDTRTSIAIAAFVTLPIPVLGAPVCFHLLSRSRLLRFMLAGFAAFDGLCFLILRLFVKGFSENELLILTIAPLFTLTGLLLIKPLQSTSIPEN